jgi:hypothetical protein
MGVMENAGRRLAAYALHPFFHGLSSSARAVSTMAAAADTLGRALQPL